MISNSATFRRFIRTLAVACALVLSACGGGTVEVTQQPVAVPAESTAVATESANPPSPSSAKSEPDILALDKWATHTRSGLEDVFSTRPDPAEVVLGKGAQLNRETLEEASAENTVATQKFTEKAQSFAKASAVTLVPVYRFFNTLTSAHFYTISAFERDQVSSTLPWFNYEGVAFQVSAGPQSGWTPVYRFYNSQTGVHFYTISESEKTLIQANLPAYQLEGIAYYASLVPGAGLAPLYRFYRPDKGFHFYTASYIERDNIINTICAYRYEGVAYYVFDANTGAIPPVAPTTSTVLIVGDSLSQGYGYGVDGGYYSFVSPGQVWTQRITTEIKTRTGKSCNNVVNVSVGGMRTEHGLASIQGWLNQYAPTDVILAQGTNDAWQNSPISTIAANLNTLVQLSRANNRNVYVLDFPFYAKGEAFRQSMTAMYTGVASNNQVPYINGAANVPFTSNFYQPDAVHLTDAAQPRVLETVWQALAPKL